MNSPRFWFFPVLSGDIRLEKRGDEGSLLTVEDPTPSDRRLLVPFLKEMRDRGHIDELVGVQSTGLTQIELPISVATAGPILAGDIHQNAHLWTAVRFTDGQMTLGEGRQLPAVVDQEPEAAVTVKRPKLGCPPPEACIRRASQVLRTFCTASQWRQFQHEGRLRVIGNHTGRAYYVYHRDQASRERLTHSLVIAGTGRAVCVWDDTVPAEEEVLGIKLGIEHREVWLLGLPRGPARHPSFLA